MADLVQELEQAVFDRLSDQVTLAPVKQHAPANSPPPLLIIESVTTSDIGSKNSVLLRADIVLIGWIRGQERKPLNALMAQAIAALDRWTPADTDGVAFTDIVLQSTSAALEPEGETYTGLARFTTFIQPG